MKKFLYYLLFAFFAFSCGKEKPSPEPGPSLEITFLLDATYPGDSSAPASAPTKVVKTGWEDGDVIFVFFHMTEGSGDVDAPSYLEMKYTTGKGWSYTKKNSLDIREGDTGTMRAVYLPFGNGASISYGDYDDFVFSTAYRSYFLTDKMSYTVQNNTVSGNFKMSVPKVGNEGYVQFYVADNNAVEDGAYRLSTDAVKPVKIVSVLPDADLTLNLQALAPGTDLPGYVYKKGYLFSGVLDDNYAYKGTYYFAKTKVSDGTRTDYFIPSATPLEHRDSRKLPANGDAKWEPVGPSKTVTLSKTASGTTNSYGTWYTCNEGANVPEETGLRLDYNAAKALVGTNKLLPSSTLQQQMISSLAWSQVSVHGIPGWVISGDTRFIFLPMSPSTGVEWYWSGTALANNPDKAYHLYFRTDGYHVVSDGDKTNQYAVRYLYQTPAQ